MNTRINWLTVMIALALAPVAAAQNVSITFKVTAPPTTPAAAKLYITGDAPALKLWAADGLELTKQPDGTFAANVALPKDRPIEYKITRGSWPSVEKGADGREMLNRTLTPTRDAVVEVKVETWADRRPGEIPATAPAAPDAAPVTQPQRPSTKSGDIRIHEKFQSRHLNNERELYVYLPPGYDDNPNQRYPVLYMHDGQNVFDAATNPIGAGEWGADETAQRLIKARQIEPLIIVGIANTPQRIDEYTFTRDEQRNQGGRGAGYIQFVAEEVKPFIDATYRTKTSPQDTAVAGSSLGATISLDICRERPDLFGKCAALSPSLWWANGDLPRRIAVDNAWVKKARIWIDMGTAEAPPPDGQQLVAMARAFGEILRKSGGVEGVNYRLETIDGAQHNERAWAARFDRVLMFLFPRRI